MKDLSLAVLPHVAVSDVAKQFEVHRRVRAVSTVAAACLRTTGPSLCHSYALAAVSVVRRVPFCSDGQQAR